MTKKDFNKIFKVHKRQMGMITKSLKRSVNKKEKAFCPKCGDEVLGDENGLCGRCV